MLQQTAGLIQTQWSRVTNDPNYTIELFIRNFTKLIAGLEKSYTRNEILSALRPLWHQFSTSPFIGRAQHWPRGYAGDYETIDYIIKGLNRATLQSPAHQLEQFLLDSPICAQHRNKIARQSKLIETLVDTRNDSRILSIGCGTSEDLVRNLAGLVRSNASVTLMDIDEAALQYSASRLAGLQSRLSLIRGNIYRSALRIPGQFELILVGGVFDYLDDRMVIAVLSALQTKVTAEGLLFFTNIRHDNPYRICMEYMANWHLVHRSEAEILNLIRSSGLQGFQCVLETDDTGLAHLVTLHA